MSDKKIETSELDGILKKAKKAHEEMMKKDIMKMTKSELVEMELFEPEGTFDSVVIVPMKENHDSDFSCMKFILLKQFEIVGAVSGHSDVVHLNGIGGYGNWHKKVPDYSKPPKGYAWSIDCLPKSKCVRFFVAGPNMELELDDFIGSDFSVFVKEV